MDRHLAAGGQQAASGAIEGIDGAVVEEADATHLGAEVHPLPELASLAAGLAAAAMPGLPASINQGTPPGLPTRGP